MHLQYLNLNVLSAETRTIIEIYRRGRLANRRLVFNLSENCSLSDDDVLGILNTYKKAFDDLKSQNVISDFRIDAKGKQCVFLFGVS